MNEQDMCQDSDSGNYLEKVFRESCSDHFISAEIWKMRRHQPSSNISGLGQIIRMLNMQRSVSDFGKKKHAQQIISYSSLVFSPYMLSVAVPLENRKSFCRVQ